MGRSVIFWQSSDAVQGVQDALTSGQVTGWDVLAAIAVLVVAYPVGLGVRRATTRGLKRIPNLPEDLAITGGSVARWFVYLVALAWALSILGVSVGWVTIIVVVVLVFGVLMLRPMVENTAAGLLLTLRPVYDVGDQIETLGYEGTVTQIASRSTVLKASDGREIHVPNTEVLSKPIVVYTATDSRKSSFDITVAFDTDLDGITRKLVDAISAVKDVNDAPAPSVEASGFHQNAITLSVSYWYPSSMSSGGAATDGAIRAATKALADAGIKLALPTLLLDPGAVSVPSASSAATPKPASDTQDTP
jgi:small conductance mechanosensitive channel